MIVFFASLIHISESSGMQGAASDQLIMVKERHQVVQGFPTQNWPQNVELGVVTSLRGVV